MVTCWVQSPVVFVVCLFSWNVSAVLSTGGYVKPGNGTFLINGIFPITDRNGKINRQSGIMMSEAMKWAIEDINKRENYLHGYKLGISSLYDSVEDEYVRKNVLETFMGVVPFLIGPYSADTSYLSSILTTTFEQLTISYSATYSDFDLYGIDKLWMLRTVPSDKFRISAALSLIEDLKWNYLAVVSSYGYDGERESLYFTKKLSTIDVCLATQIDLSKYPTKQDYQAAMSVLNSDPRLRGIVLFTTIEDTRNIMSALNDLKLQDRFLLVCMYGCTSYVKVTNGNEAVADGTLSLDIHVPEIPEFKKYFLDKKITENSTRTFMLFWEEVFECSLNQTDMRDYQYKCTGKERLSDGKGYYANTPVHTVIDAVFHIGKALRDFIALYCYSNHKWMSESENCVVAAHKRDKHFEWSYKFLMRSAFKDGTLSPLSWQDKENGTAVRYEVFQYTRQRGNQRIWQWQVLRNRSTNLVYNKRCNFFSSWYSYQNMTALKNYGTCSSECELGQIKDYDQNSLKSKCCWSCKKCTKNNRVVNNTCTPCAQTEMVGIEYKTCKSLPARQIEWHDVATVLFTFFSVTGLCCTIFFAVVFYKFNNHRIVRAAGRDLSCMILIGVCLTFACPFVFLSRTNQLACILRGALPGFAFLTCYTPLFLKTNRIYRIFVGAQVSVSRPALVSCGSQFIVLCIILALQLFISVIWFVSKTPIPEAIVYRDEFIAVHCSGDNNPILLLLNLSLSVIFMISCTVLAFKTRHFPKNFNEAKYIGITLYITCVAWAVFLPAYYLVPRMNENFAKEFLMCGVCLFIGFVTLLGLFGPKVKMLLWGPAPPTSNNSLPTWYVTRTHSKSTSSNHSYYSPKDEEMNGMVML